MSHNTQPTRFEFRLYLMLKKKALMPATYYLYFLVPIFNRTTATRYHKSLDFLIEQASKDEFIEIVKVNHSRDDDKLVLTDPGREFLHWGRFTDVLIEKKSKKINIYLAVWGAIGGVSTLILLLQGYTHFISWLATIWP